jgi:hypothetical protein
MCGPTLEEQISGHQQDADLAQGSRCSPQTRSWHRSEIAGAQGPRRSPPDGPRVLVIGGDPGAVKMSRPRRVILPENFVGPVDEMNDDAPSLAEQT